MGRFRRQAKTKSMTQDIEFAVKCLMKAGMTREEAVAFSTKKKEKQNKKKPSGQYTREEFGSVMEVVSSFRKSPEEEEAIRR